MRFYLLIPLIIICNALFAQNAKKNWTKVMRSCNASQTVGKETLFFGPSNTIGLGSVWRKAKDHGYNPRFELADLIPDSNLRKKMITLGAKSSVCSDTGNTLWQPTVALPFLGQIFGLTGVSVELHRARRTKISVDSLALDVLKELPFEQALHQIGLDDPKNVYLADLLNNPDRLIITKGYRLTGLAVTLDFDPKLLDSIKAKYPMGGGITIGGDKGLNVQFNYQSDHQVTIKLPVEVYIAGEFSRIDNGGNLQLNDPTQAQTQLVAVKIDPEATVGKIVRVKPK